MTTKFANFVAALEQLCVEHDVSIHADFNDEIVVHDRQDEEKSTTWFVDCTKEQ